MLLTSNLAQLSKNSKYKISLNTKKVKAFGILNFLYFTKKKYQSHACSSAIIYHDNGVNNDQ